MTKDTVSFSDFQKLDLRVGKVTEALKVAGSVNLLRLKVDMGKEYGIKNIFAGLAKYYKPQELKGKKFIFVANLAPKQMMNEMSEGMILCSDDESKIGLIPIKKKVTEGALIR